MTETKAKRAKKEAVGAPIVAYKGFDENLQCRGFQYEVGKTYEHSGNVSICSTGFHACDNPFDVLNYYDITGRFAKVTLGGDISRENGGDTKIASGKITIEAEIKLPEFIKSAIAWVMRSAKLDDDVQVASGNSSKLAASGYSSQLAASGRSSQLAASGDSSKLAASGYSSKLAASGDYSQLAASGYSSQLAASGYSSQLAASGYSSQLAASGRSSQLAASGDSSKLAASGYSSKLAASGNSSKLAASGDYSQLAASGNYSQLAASGNYSQLEITGKNGVISASSPNCTAKGVIGTWISLPEFNNKYECIGFASGCVGQDGLVADTWYRARGGKLVAA
jgi:hypothetical protein